MKYLNELIEIFKERYDVTFNNELNRYDLVAIIHGNDFSITTELIEDMMKFHHFNLEQISWELEKLVNNYPEDRPTKEVSWEDIKF